MDAPAVIARLREALPDAVVEDGAAAKDPWVRVAPARVRDALILLRDAPDLAFDFTRLPRRNFIDGAGRLHDDRGVRNRSRNVDDHIA